MKGRHQGACSPGEDAKLAADYGLRRRNWSPTMAPASEDSGRSPIDALPEIVGSRQTAASRSWWNIRVSAEGTDICKALLHGRDRSRCRDGLQFGGLGAFGQVGRRAPGAGNCLRAEADGHHAARSARPTGQASLPPAMVRKKREGPGDGHGVGSFGWIGQHTIRARAACKTLPNPVPAR